MINYSRKETLIPFFGKRIKENIMKQTFKISALLLAIILVFSAGMQTFAADSAAEQAAYANIVTFSDVQTWGPGAFKEFGKVMRVIQKDGVSEPDSLLVGGDYSRFMYDYATLGIIQLREQYMNVCPGANPDDIVCIQGNHDQSVASFCPTGMYDMGTFCLYIMNEDDFPWEQGDNESKADTVKASAKKLSDALDSLTASGDTRPVIVLTHVPLHFTRRDSYGDNLYASYIFDVLNRAGEKLDIIFLFGHNYSDDYDDYIGGSVNYLARGETILIPAPEKRGENGYNEEKLNFTYTNCGYIGYSGNGKSDTSTDILTLGLIKLFSDKIEISKYSRDGVFRSDIIERINDASEDDTKVQTTSANLKYNNPSFRSFEYKFLAPLLRLYLRIFGVFSV